MNAETALGPSASNGRDALTRQAENKKTKVGNDTMGKLEFAGSIVEITPADYYTLMVSASDRMLYCQQNMEKASDPEDFGYWRKERDRAASVRLKLVTHKDF